MNFYIIYLFLFSKPAMNSSKDAPIAPFRISPSIPSIKLIANAENNHPAIRPPTIPSTILINTPNPPPFINFPANHPADAPMINE